MRNFSIIVAIDSQYGIGKAGGLAWHLPEDLKHFKAITTTVSQADKRNAVLMGRKTWESLPEKFRPLPNRYNVVLTRESNFLLPDGVGRASSLDQALEQMPVDVESVFVIGGAQIYQQALDHQACKKLFITHVKGDFACDAFFPPISRQFLLVSATLEAQQNDITYHFAQYLRCD